LSEEANEVGFWSNFLAGIASGIVVTLLAVFLRNFFKHSENRLPFKFEKKVVGLITLGIVMIGTLGAIIFLAVSGKEIPFALYMIFIISGGWFYWSF
jgi:hypothetical protein